MYIIYYKKKTQHNTRSKSFKMKYDLKLLTKKNYNAKKKKLTNRNYFLPTKKNIFVKNCIAPIVTVEKVR